MVGKQHHRVTVGGNAVDLRLIDFSSYRRTIICSAVFWRPWVALVWQILAGSV
jgi:hypothetical protein